MRLHCIQLVMLRLVLLAIMPLRLLGKCSCMVVLQPPCCAMLLLLLHAWCLLGLAAGAAWQVWQAAGVQSSGHLHDTQCQVTSTQTSTNSNSFFQNPIRPKAALLRCSTHLAQA